MGGPVAALAATLVAILAAMVVLTSTASDTAQAQSSTQPRVLGAWIGTTPTDSTTSLEDPTKLDKFASMVGAKPGVVQFYQVWGDPTQDYQNRINRAHFNPKTGTAATGPGMMDEVAGRGAMPMVTWSLRNPGNDRSYPLRDIIAGNHDAYIEQWARDAAAWGKPFYLRFAHEMNGTWQPWSPGVNGNTAAEYGDAWRHVHDIFRRVFEEEQAAFSNVRWVWSPYVACGGCTAFGKVYPGDAYVDWVALDGYNWGGSSWQSMSSVFRSSYNSVTTLAPRKPFMIAEIGSVEGAAGAKANWIKKGYSTTIPDYMPKTRAIVWFHSYSDRDWRVNTSTSSLNAYKNVATNAAYQGTMP